MAQKMQFFGDIAEKRIEKEMKEIMKEQGYKVIGYSKYNSKQYEYWSQEKTTMKTKTVEDRAIDKITEMYAKTQDKSWAFRKTTKEEIEKVKDFHQKMGFNEKKGVMASSINRVKETIKQEQIQKAEKYIQNKIEKGEHVSMSKIEKDTGVSRAAVKEAIKSEMEKGTIESKSIQVQGKDRTIYVATEKTTTTIEKTETKTETKDMERTASAGRGR
jgi:DNA-binding FadR family transcriptional regulator